MTELFSLRPQVAGYSESRSWSTSVFEAQTGKEVRDQNLTANPLRMVTMQLNTSTQRQVQRVKMAAKNAIETIVYVPLWMSASPLTAATVGNNSNSLDTTDREFAVGEWAVLWASEDDFEVQQISGVTSSSITTGTAFSSGYPIGTLVIPAIQATLVGSPSLSYIDERNATVALSFEEWR